MQGSGARISGRSESAGAKNEANAECEGGPKSSTGLSASGAPNTPALSGISEFVGLCNSGEVGLRSIAGVYITGVDMDLADGGHEQGTSGS